MMQPMASRPPNNLRKATDTMTPILSRLTVALLAAGLACSALPLNAAVTAVTPSATQQEESWTINLKGADIREFIDQVAQISGQTFVVDPRVKGQVSVVSNSPLTLTEVYQLFLSVMATVRNFVCEA